MLRNTTMVLSLFAFLVSTSVAVGQESSKPRDNTTGYWEFVESFIDHYPPIEKRNKAGLYELKWAPRQVTTRVGNMVGPGGNIEKEPVAERTDVWTWTTLPGILVPGERHPVKLAYKVVAMRGIGPETTMAAGFVLAAPRDKEVYLINNATGKFYGNGVVGPKDLSRLFNTREPSEIDGTIIVPKLGYADSSVTKLIDFAVVIAPGQSFTNSVNYRYKWVEGVPPPADQRRGGVRDPGEADPPDTDSGTTPTDNGSNTSIPPTGIAEPADTTKFTVQAGVRRAKSGEVVRVPVYLLNPGGVANVNATISYIASVAAADGKPIRGNVLGSALFEVNASETGIARVGFAGSKPVTDSGILAHIAFKAVGNPGDRTVLKVTVSTANMSDGKSIAAETIDGSILIVGDDGKIPGDHDGDGIVTAGDALSALKMSVKLIDEDKNLDMDKDANVTSNDARMILLKAVGK